VPGSVASPEPTGGAALWLLERLRRLLAQMRDGLSLMSRAAGRGVLEVFDRSDDLTHAAAIAYYALLSFLPFLLLSMSVFGSLASGQFARGQVLELVSRYFPAQPDFIEKNFDLFWQTRLKLGLGGAIALLWASQGVFGAISTAVNHAWAVERPRSFWGHRGFTLLMMSVAGMLLFGALLILSTASIRGTTWTGLLFAQSPALAPLVGWASKLVTFLVFVCVVGMIFYFVPNTNVRLRDVWPGAVVTALLWRGAFEVFSWYVRHFARASIHGSIATVVWFLLWIYISAVILLYGVEFTAAFARIRRERRGTVPPIHAS
jgi:membrane protein